MVICSAVYMRSLHLVCCCVLLEEPGRDRSCQHDLAWKCCSGYLPLLTEKQHISATALMCIRCRCYLQRSNAPLLLLSSAMLLTEEQCIALIRIRHLLPTACRSGSNAFLPLPLICTRCAQRETMCRVCHPCVLQTTPFALLLTNVHHVAAYAPLLRLVHMLCTVAH